MRLEGLKISSVVSDSIACEVGLAPGDRIISINGEPVLDMIDLRFLEACEELCLLVIKKDGSALEFDIEKDYDESLGVDFGEDNFKETYNCANKCLFCFVDQMPPDMRQSLYVKDDDYRLSFWDGTFITLTNLSQVQMQRIAALHLSPLYISVHTTNPALRERMLGNKKAGLIMEQLRFFADAGIEMHTQVVLCPGINDGLELERTLTDLASLLPMVQSMAVVPVGLTGFRKNRADLRSFSFDEAVVLMEWLTAKQDKYLVEWDNPFIFASDEFYLQSGFPIPEGAHYAGFPQLENGVGLTRLFLDEWAELQPQLPESTPPFKATIVTSVLGAGIIKDIVARLNRVKGLEVNLAVVKNNFFGSRITVAGLLTGDDIIKQIKPESIGDLLILPKVMLKKDEEVFLDGITLVQLEESLKKPVAVADGPIDLVRQCGIVFE
ncbi:MAG: DUF512 domain-containing protein [Peptococcaceae bacterium]|nr:DUF512 domain-containing protein [Peptococcaceae bacterium]